MDAINRGFECKPLAAREITSGWYWKRTWRIQWDRVC